MKNKLNYILLTAILLLNLACTNDDFENEELSAVSKKETAVNLSEADAAASAKTADTTKVSINAQLAVPDGEPFNPKVK
ncbi:hypothetical protein [Flavobacterium sp.]|uniref:hypothetical protein n=1 Tax=Flavobacterium sp. TaxID=239 RepID=UPI0031DBA4DE